MAKSKETTYSQALSELEKIVKGIESEEMEVDVLAEKIKRASFLVSYCREKLTAVEDEVRKVISGIEERPLEGPPDEEDDGF
ncbi:MAG: exodeoxyribonuclease VII small subunit [Nitrospirae bacterium]|nr:exodeoxyribonuclease VII small subunit [Nitrospirota bacterium]